MNRKEIRIPLPAGVEAKIENSTISIQSKGHVCAKTFSAEGVGFRSESDAVVVFADVASNRQVSKMNAVASHIENLVKGVQKDFEYKLTVVFSHFPMTVNVKDNAVEINNFLGEKKPRKAKIIAGTKVVVKGKDLFVSGSNKESVGQTAANIEGAARVVGRDKRVFQDGIFIVSKGKTDLA